MAKMTKMLRYQTSSGTTGACAIYTTLDECPYPNLKVQVDGTNGYVKLSADVNDPNKTPIKVYVNSSGQTLNALTQAIPTGSMRITRNITFTVPAGITVIQVGTIRPTYIRVLPNSTHQLVWDVDVGEDTTYSLECATHTSNKWTRYISLDSRDVTLYWSPTINTHATNVNCY